MTDPFSLLGANIRIAANLRYAKEREEEDERWGALDERLGAIGCKLSREDLVIFDRNEDPIDIGGISDEESQDYDMALHFVEQLEARGGIRP